MELSGLLADKNVLMILKVGILGVFAFYILFAFVVVRQVNKMTDTLEVGFEAPIRFVAWAHLLVSIGVFLISLVIL